MCEGFVSLLGRQDTAIRALQVQGYLAHEKQPPPYDPTVALYVETYGDPRGMGRQDTAIRALQVAHVKRFRGGLVFKADRLVYDSTLGWRVKKKNTVVLGQPLYRGDVQGHLTL